jgi:Ca-activated chloride channel family protein
VGEYAKTLPPPRGGAPVLAVATKGERAAREVAPQLMRVTANVTDRQGRAIAGLERKDFIVSEGEAVREVVEVEPARTPFNLVLLLDVSGSVEERLDFVRKSALAFVNTVSPQDRVAIISFRDDIQLISDFTTDRSLLAQRIKDIEAGGGTALYDALAYTLIETLKPLRDQRTAIVVISDGDDNRSFIPFPNILETIIETGAVVYPLYIPSGLVPASSAPAAATTLDPTRTRYLALTSRADEEGRKLASVSGGVYYPVRRYEELQRAYDDVVAQLRTSYTISYATTSQPARGRVRVRVAREGAVVRLSPAVGAATSQPN